MIVKFDHITFVESRDKKALLLRDLGEPLFVEEKLMNIKIKRDLMHYFQEDHDLFFYKNNYPIEYIFYDKVDKYSTISLKDGTIYGEYYDKKNALDYLKGIFGEKVTEIEDTIVCSMRGILDDRDYDLILEKSEKRKPSYLDDGGYGIAALVINFKYCRKPCDGICTDFENLVVNGKKLDICFTKSDSTNIIFEMIRVCG